MTDSYVPDTLPGHGWIPDPEDPQDRPAHHPAVLAAQLPWEDQPPHAAAPLPGKADLREWLPPVQNQGLLPTCTAHVVAGMVAYLTLRADGEQWLSSRLFNYRVARNLMGTPEHVGAHIRSAVAALALVGAVDERYWPYDPRSADVEPPPFCYALARNYRAVTYFRIDTDGVTGDDYLNGVRRLLARGLPASIGIPLTMSVMASFKTGMVPLPDQAEPSLGGHVILVVGYDDQMSVPASAGGGKASRGALLIRNSWGEEWGDKGYGWLPYEFVRRGVGSCSWAVASERWVDVKEFDLHWHSRTETVDEATGDATTGNRATVRRGSTSKAVQAGRGRPRRGHR